MARLFLKEAGAHLLTKGKIEEGSRNDGGRTLNRDFRYLSTLIGATAPNLFIAERKSLAECSAIADYTRAVEIKPNYCGAFYHRGNALRRKTRLRGGS